MSVIAGPKRLLCRWRRANACRVVTLFALGLLITTPQTWAAADQLPNSSTPSATKGEALFVPPARQVVLDDLSQASPSQLAAHPATLRPRDGLTDEQHRALKLKQVSGPPSHLHLQASPD